MAHDLMCAMNFLATFDEMWFLASGPMVTVPKFFASERTAGVFSRSSTVRKTSNSRRGYFFYSRQKDVSEGGAAFGVGFAHAGNYIGLPSNTAPFLSTGNKYLFLFQHHLIPCDC